MWPLAFLENIVGQVSNKNNSNNASIEQIANFQYLAYDITYDNGNDINCKIYMILFKTSWEKNQEKSLHLIIIE